MDEDEENHIERMRNLYNFDCFILLVLLILIVFLLKNVYES